MAEDERGHVEKGDGEARNKKEGGGNLEPWGRKVGSKTKRRIHGYLEYPGG